MISRIDPYRRQTYLNRLARLLRLRREFRDDLNPVGFDMLERAIEATRRDCEEVGAAGQARELLEKAR